MLSWKTSRQPRRAHLSSQASTATIPWGATQKPPRTSARARMRRLGCTNRQTRTDRMLSWKSNRQPLRAHLSSLASMATTLLRTVHSPPRTNARARARRRARAAWHADRRTREGRMLSWKSNRQPLRGHLSFHANMAAVILRTVQAPTSESARALRGTQLGGRVKAACSVGNPLGNR